MQSGTYNVSDDAMFATIYALRPDTTAGFRPTPAFVVNHGIDLWFSFAAEDAVESLKFDGLQAIVESPRFCKLVIASDDSEGNQYKTFKRILHSVLERKKLTWALDSHKLQFDGSGKDEIIRSADILSVPTEDTDGDITITLNIAQQAEWLLRFTQHKRSAYLRALAYERGGGESRTEQA